ncbi:hypothetical protein SteCoe_37206 [Stentor coeruleus]|uniref:Aurora kinase n=1 Tax=Stentor coeruleus TaxID=5963 RepID=A0A1R2ANJ1_9CILI|nr:hypothetical protein SteCoe_37206 [Stentor coeruleus]
MKCAYSLCKDSVTNPQKCPKCKEVTYCCTSCRAQDWYKNHQKVCPGNGASPLRSASPISKNSEKPVEPPAKPSVDKKVQIDQSKKDQLSDYEDMNSSLGSGSYAEVKLVKHKRTKVLSAMKIVNKKLAEQELSIEIINREIAIHSKLNHPHIIKLFNSFTDETNIYLVLEYAESGSLFEKIEDNGKLTEDEARKFFVQTVNGIIYLHENEIVHRDVKPENILLDKSGNVKICDFGWCARGTEDRSTFCGTLDYMAPEIIKGQKHSYEVDIWALGVLLYEILHGYSPFQGREADKCHNIVNCKFSFDDDISENAKDLIQKMVKVQAASRIKLKDVLNHPFCNPSSPIPVVSVVCKGATFKHYVQGHGMDIGTVQDVKGSECIVTFAKSGVREIMLYDEVERRIKRGKRDLSPTVEENKIEEKAIEPEKPQKPVEKNQIKKAENSLESDNIWLSDDKINKDDKKDKKNTKQEIKEQAKNKNNDEKNNEEKNNEVKNKKNEEKNKKNEEKNKKNEEKNKKSEEKNKKNEEKNKKNEEKNKKSEEKNKKSEERNNKNEEKNKKKDEGDFMKEFNQKFAALAAQEESVDISMISAIKNVNSNETPLISPRDEFISNDKGVQENDKHALDETYEEFKNKLPKKNENLVEIKKGPKDQKIQESIKNKSPVKSIDYKEEIKKSWQKHQEKEESDSPSKSPLKLQDYLESKKKSNENTEDRAKTPDRHQEILKNAKNLSNSTDHLPKPKEKLAFPSDSESTYSQKDVESSGRKTPQKVKFADELVIPPEVPRSPIQSKEGFSKPPLRPSPLEDPELKIKKSYEKLGGLSKSPKKEIFSSSKSSDIDESPKPIYTKEIVSVKKDEEVYNNLENWVKAPERKVREKSPPPAPRDRSLDKSLERFKEKYGESPKPEPKDPSLKLDSFSQLALNSKGGKVSPREPIKQSEENRKKLSDESQKGQSQIEIKPKFIPFILKNEEDSEESQEQSLKGRSISPFVEPQANEKIENEKPRSISAIKSSSKDQGIEKKLQDKEEEQSNIYKQRILENLRKAKEEEEKKSMQIKPKSVAEIKGNQKISVENVFNIPENPQKRNSSPPSPKFQEDDDEEISHSNRLKGCSIFDEHEKASVNSNLRRTPSPNFRREQVEEVKKVYNPKDFEPEPKKGGKKKVSNFEYQRELIENQHNLYYRKLEEAWITNENDVVEAVDISDNEVETPRPQRHFEEYDYLLRNPPSVISNIDDTESKFIVSNERLNQKRKELAEMIEKVEGEKKIPLKIKRVKKKKDGLLSWLGGLMGCSERY